jgi:hypothetical protein
MKKMLYSTYDVLSGIKLAGIINLNRGTVPLKFGLGCEHFQKIAQLATEIFNNISCEKSVAGPKEFSLGC